MYILRSLKILIQDLAFLAVILILLHSRIGLGIWNWRVNNIVLKYKIAYWFHYLKQKSATNHIPRFSQNFLFWQKKKKKKKEKKERQKRKYVKSTLIDWIIMQNTKTTNWMYFKCLYVITMLPAIQHFCRAKLPYIISYVFKKWVFDVLNWIKSFSSPHLGIV